MKTGGTETGHVKRLEAQKEAMWRGWSDTTTSQGTPWIVHNHPKLEERHVTDPPHLHSLQKEHGPADTLLI